MQKERSAFTLDSIFANPLVSSIQRTHKELKTWKIQPIKLFPYTEFITKGDQFFKRVWWMIDNSKEYFWITTYAINSSPAADTTLLKLIEAAKRGVHVVLFIDNVQYWPKTQLIQTFQNHGGRFHLLNPQFTRQSIEKYFTKQVWRRHHQKLIVSDNRGLIGSSNIQGNYAGIKYGNCMFQDMNYYTQNIILDEYRKHFVQTADYYDYNLHTKMQNQTLLTKMNAKFPNSTLYPKDKYVLLHNDPATNRKQIQEAVIKMVNTAERQIKIIQPYHYPMLKFDRSMQSAAKRGISSKIMTSGQRDQPVFKSIFNYMLFQRLILKGIKVYQTKQRLLHTKVYLSDGRYLNLGSMNNDRWSWKINNEVNIAIDDQREALFVQQYFNKMLARCREVTNDYTISAKRAAAISFWQNFLYLSEIVMSKQGQPQEAYVKQDEDQIVILDGNNGSNGNNGNK